MQQQTSREVSTSKYRRHALNFVWEDRSISLCQQANLRPWGITSFEPYFVRSAYDDGAREGS